MLKLDHILNVFNGQIEIKVKKEVPSYGIGGVGAGDLNCRSSFFRCILNACTQDKLNAKLRVEKCIPVDITEISSTKSL